MKKILISLMAIALVIGLVGAGTMAYFSDEETSSDNIFQAGVVDLEMEVNDVASGKVEFTNIAPCEDLAPVTIKFTNLGDIWAWVNMELEFTENDAAYAGEFSGDDMTPAQFAKLLYVKQFTWDDTAELGGPWDIVLDGVILNSSDFRDSNGDGLLSLWEMQESAAEIKASSRPGEGPPPARDCIFSMPKKTVTWELTFHLADAFAVGDNVGEAYTGGMASYAGTCKIYQGAPVAWNVPQADGITVDVTVYLDQRIPQP